MSNIDIKIEAVDTPVEQEVKTSEKRSIPGVVFRFLKNNFYLYGGPLIAAILLSYYGPRFHLVTYTTVSANLMLREWGLTFFLASTGLAAGDMFIEAFVSGIGWVYLALGLVISVVPMAVMAVVARRFMRLNFHTIAGLIAGASTSSSALSFVNSLSERGLAVLAYSTVYPLAMFLRIISGQIILMLFFSMQ